MSDESLQQARSSIGSNPNILPIPIITPEGLQFWQEPMIVKTVSPGHSFILGSSSNGVLGTWTSSADGTQVLLGNYSDVQVSSIISSSFRYYNFLRDTPACQSAYGLVAAQTTATVNTTLHKLDFSTGTAAVFKCHTNDNRITQAGVFMDTDSGRTNLNFSTNTTLQVSANAGTNWTTVSNATMTTLGTAGTAVWFRITCSSAAGYWKTADASGYELPIRVVFA